MRHTPLVFVTAVLLALALPPYGQDFRKGLDAANSDDYATALRKWRPLAEQGFADPWESVGAFECLLGQYQELGVTEFIIDHPGGEQFGVLEKVAVDVMSGMR